MILVKRQLKTYHKAQGLTGKRLKRAVWADVGRVVVNADWPRHKIAPKTPIDALFSFCHSPEGGKYWGRRVYPYLYRNR